MKDNCAVIIPSIKLDEDTIKCIKECLKQEQIKVKVYLVTNYKIKRKLKLKNLIYLSYGDINMSEKRNKAVKKSKEKYIAFIDSDAYPEKKWLYNAINILKKNRKIGMITGPDLPFKNQKGWSHHIAEAHKSFLLSGTKVFRKNLKKKTKCLQASSCNMILERKIFKKLNGMDEDIYIGEDKDLCDKLRKFKSILYSPNVVIYHRVREFKPFLLQRFSYGSCIKDIVRNNSEFNLNNIQYFVPLFITLFYLFFPIFFSIDYFSDFAVISLISLNLIITFESLKIALNPLNFLKIFLIINISILSFGLGSLANILGLNKNIKELYTKR